MATQLTIVERDFYTTVYGGSPTTPLNQIKREFFEKIGLIGYGLSDLENQFLRRVRIDFGGDGNSIHDGDLWNEVVGLISANPSKYTNDNKIKFYTSAVPRLIYTTQVMNGLVAYYPLNETSGTTANNRAVDTRGTLNGTITGVTVGQSGKVGKAYSFDGVGDDVDLGNNSALAAGSGSFSFGQIVNVGTSTSVFSLSSRSGASGANGGYDIIVGDGGVAGKIRVRIADGTTSFQTDQSTVSTNNWHLLVGVINKTDNTLGLYVDDQSIITVDISTAGAVSNSQNPNIGKRGSTIFTNKIQHTFMLNRVITANEALKLARIAGLA